MRQEPSEGIQGADSLAQFEVMATALLDAYRTGTPEAMERHWQLTWHRRSWPAMRTYVQLDLGKRTGDDVEITLDDARHLVALEHGFERWLALEAFVTAPPPAGIVTAKPVQVMTAPSSAEHATADETASSSSREWNAVLRMLEASNATGLDAHGQMTDALLEDVSRMTHLTTLRLGGSKAVTDDGVRHLSRLPGLKHLDLQGTGITDGGLQVLRNLPALETISLSWTRVSDAGAQHLSHCDALEDVNVSGTWCGDGTVRALTGKPKLRHFQSGNQVTDQGLTLFHEFPVFKEWQGGAPDAALYKADKDSNRLLLRGAITDGGMANLRGLDGLFGLNLDDSALGLTGAALAPLIDLPHLGVLAFDAKDDAMPYIARMPQLRALAIQDTTSSDDGWVALSRSTSIERIWGRRCYGLERRGFLALATMPRLLNLAVSCKNVDDTALAALPHFPALRELMPMDVPDAGYRHIGACAELQSLVLMYCRDTGDEATSHITGLQKLGRYFASYNLVTDRTPALLSRMESLEQITFDSCAALTNAGIAALATLPRLRELRISGQGLTADVKAAFPSQVTVHFSL